MDFHLYLTSSVGHKVYRGLIINIIELNMSSIESAKNLDYLDYLDYFLILQSLFLVYHPL